jgi:hypothetical protein
MVVLFLGLSSTGLQAQRGILRDLRDRTIDKAVDKVIDRTSEQLAEQMANAIMSILTPNLEKMMEGSGNTFDPALLPDQYTFDYLYQMKVTSQEGEMVIDYYLSKDNPNHVGVEFGSGTEMFMVIDGELQATVTYMTIGDKLHATAMENMVPEEEEEENLDRLEDFSITEVPSKEFLGYNCLGRKMEDESYEFLMYIAPNMEAHMGSLFAPSNQEKSSALEAYGQQFANGLMMYMEITDKKGSPGSNMDGTMECIAYEPQARTITNRDYLFGQGMRSSTSR